MTLLATTLLATALVLSACGDDDEPTGTAAESDAAGAGGAGEAASGETVTVAIPEFAFDPGTIEIAAGDAVVWENTHSQPHTSSGNGDQDWDTGNIEPGEASDPVLFEEPGTFTYLCALHPFMEGTVEVSG